MTNQHHALPETMGAYLLEDLDEAERTRLRGHVNECSPCLAELASLTPIVAALADVDLDVLDDAPTPDVTLEQRILDQIAGERRRQRRRTAVRIGALASATALLAVLGVRCWRSTPSSPSIAPHSTDGRTATVDRHVGAVDCQDGPHPLRSRFVEPSCAAEVRRV